MLTALRVVVMLFLIGASTCTTQQQLSRQLSSVLRCTTSQLQQRVQFLLRLAMPSPTRRRRLQHQQCIVVTSHRIKSRQVGREQAAETAAPSG